MRTSPAIGHRSILRGDAKSAQIENDLDAAGRALQVERERVAAGVPEGGRRQAKLDFIAGGGWGLGLAEAARGVGEEDRPCIRGGDADSEGCGAIEDFGGVDAGPDAVAGATPDRC